MAWSADKTAGFALAALLADDRQLNATAAQLAAEQISAVRAQLTQTADATRLVRTLLGTLRPPLDERALRLPPRARTLLARLAPRELRRQLLQGAPAAREHYSAHEELIATLVRVARRQTRSVSP